jgi:hypothetical protein
VAITISPRDFTVHHSWVSLPFSWSRATYFKVTSHAGSDEQTTLKRWRMIMKTILSTLVALSVLAGVAATSAQAATFGSQEYWVERDRNAN